MVKEKKHLQKIHYMTLTYGSRSIGQGHTKCCPVPSKSYDLCTCKIWNCYVQQFRRRYIYKKVHYLTLTFTLNVAQCPLHHVTYAPTEFEVTTSKALGGEAFTRKSIFDLWPWGQGHTKCCPVPSTSCDLFSYKVWSCYVKRFRRRCIYKKIQYLTFDLDLGVKVTQNVAQYPLHHVTYSATKFKVATSNRLGGDTFTRKYNIWPFTLSQGHKKCCPVPFTSCDLFNYIVWSFYLLRFRRRYIYKKRDGRTYARTDGRRTDFDTKLIYTFFKKKKAGIITVHWSIDTE